MSTRPGTAAATTPDGSIHELVEHRLRQSDLRYTTGRRAIVELLLRRGQPASIADVEAALPKVPRSSAYRHLVDLQGVGVVRRVAANDDFTRFELAEDLTEHHHHLLCTSCGSVTDVTPTEAFEHAVHTMVEEFSRQEGFQPLSHSLDVLGHCKSCR
ncbi:MAG TPA: Fur family transcriptional regulator [Acidimicrobiales bacterium]|nr:Fur family transcriptional regulator [Acidimicrobiales bacterium]